MNSLDRLPSSINSRRSTATAPNAAHPACALLLAAVAALPLIATASAVAQVQDERPQQTPLERVGEPLEETSVDEEDYGEALSFSAGSTFTTEYWFRGYLQEDQGFIAQPYAELGIGLFVPEDESYSLDANVGIWNSFHSEKTGAADTGPSTWYESDLYGGLSFTTGDFELGVVYTFYTYPSGSLDTIQEVGLYTGYGWDLAGDPDRSDDIELTLGIGGGVFFETADSGGTEDTYAELNVEPGLEFEVGDGTPISLTFPVAVGFSIEDYYFDDAGDDEPFGYVSASAAVGVPLPMPARYGEWSLTGALTGVFLGADSLTTISGAEDSNLFGSLTIDISY